MREYSPGASIRDDYAYYCDMCEDKSGKPCLIWRSLPGRKGHFAICYDCIRKLFFEYCAPEKGAIAVEVTRAVITEQLRNEIYERDGYKCVKCGSLENLQIDHIIPFSKGGRTEKDNLQTLCKQCNSKKRAKVE